VYARTASGNTVLPSLFASRWAMLLFSHDPRHRQWWHARAARSRWKKSLPVQRSQTLPGLPMPSSRMTAPKRRFATAPCGLAS